MIWGNVKSLWYTFSDFPPTASDTYQGKCESSVVCDLDLIQNSRLSLRISYRQWFNILPLRGFLGIIKQIWNPSGGNIIQIWHPCGVANMVVYPEWALSPEGVARGWQCSRGVDYHVSNPAGMSHLFYYTEQHPPPPPPSPPGTQNTWQVETYKTHLGSVISEEQVYRADHVKDILHVFNLSFLNNLPPQLGWDFTFSPIIETLAQVVPNNKIIPLLTAAFCWGLEILSPRAGIWKHDVLNNIGNHETAHWQRVLIRRLLDSGRYSLSSARCHWTYRHTGC